MIRKIVANSLGGRGDFFCEGLMKQSQADRIRQAVTDFVRAGDHRDVALLDRVLHKDFRVVSYGFMGTPGVTLIDKEKYLANVRSGAFGGLPRQMRIELLDESETIASVKLRLESSENHFVSYNALVLDSDDAWKLIQNLAIVTAKGK